MWFESLESFLGLIVISVSDLSLSHCDGLGGNRPLRRLELPMLPENRSSGAAAAWDFRKPKGQVCNAETAKKTGCTALCTALIIGKLKVLTQLTAKHY